jgi:hypothetical protein
MWRLMGKRVGKEEGLMGFGQSEEGFPPDDSK